MRRLTWVSVQMMRIRASIKQSVHHLRLGFAPTNNVFQSFQSRLHRATSQKSLVLCLPFIATRLYQYYLEAKCSILGLRIVIAPLALE